MTTLPPTPTLPTTLADELVTYIAAEVAVVDGDVAADTDLLMTGLVDSLGVVRIVGWIEDRLGIEIDPGDVVIEHFISVEAMITYLGQRSDA